MYHHGSRLRAALLVLAVSCLFAAALGRSSAAASPPTSYVQLNGYGGVAEEVLTPDDVILFGTVGSFGSPYGPPQPDLFISSLDLGTFERWQITLVPPLGTPLAPGTYANAGGFGAFPDHPAIQVLHTGGLPFNYSCDGGSFTVHNIDLANSYFDVEWTQSCLGLPVSGHAVFVAPPDRTPPIVQVPSGGVYFPATGPGGAAVTYEVSAQDGVDGSLPVTCTQASGSTFPIGRSSVDCHATDSSGNTGYASFDVFVFGAEAQLESLISVVTDLGPGTSLADKLVAARSALKDHLQDEACAKLKSFANDVRAQAGKKISAAQAGELVANANRIQAVLGC